MIESPYDMFAKEYKTCFPVHGMIQDSYGKPKTPYQLDLEVKDRKPSIVPKVGDRVKIKSLDWYEKWKTPGLYEHVDVPFAFNNSMACLCGQILTVCKVEENKFSMEHFGGELRWSFSLEMFEEVYPVQEQLSSKFPKIDLSCHLPLETPSQEDKGELIVNQVDFGSMIEEAAKRLSAYTLVKGLDAKPKLKQVKTTHLIKLKKL